MTALIPVTAAPLLDPGHGRLEMELPEGATVAQMVAAAFPRLAPGDYRFLRVSLVSPAGSALILERYWSQTRPRPGTRVVIRLVPGDENARGVLTVVVAIAALAIAPQLAPVLFSSSGALATSVTAAGLTLAGNLLVNALIPLKQPSAPEQRNSYQLQGWQNEARPGDPIPCLFGRHRYAPPVAATPYSVIIGDDQYVHMVLCPGYGRLNISDIRLGETSIDNFDDVDVEIREGEDGDQPLSLYPRQVLEQAEGVELTRPFPRDASGNITGGASIETPVVRTTASDTQTASVIFQFPQGLFLADFKGEIQPTGVAVRIRQRAVGETEWQEVEYLTFTSETRTPFFRQYSWNLPSRGRWEVELTRATDEATDASVSNRVTLAALQSIRPEYPLNIDVPLALVALRAKAGSQLSGVLDQVNMLVERYMPTWDGEEWTDGLGRNPASAYLAALKGPANPFPATDAEIDLVQLADWYDWCAAKGLKYDRVHDQAEALGDMLAAICAAGRATPRHDGTKWGVVIDRPDAMVIDHVNPRNSAEFKWSRAYFEPPHAVRVTFRDETDDYAQAERIVPWPGHTGPIRLVETWEFPGKTDPDEIWIEVRRRMYELVHRPDTFTAVQSGAVRVATRGDLVMGSFDVLTRTQVAARVKGVTGALVELDEIVTIEAGTEYGLRYRTGVGEEDVIGTSTVATVAGDTGSRRAIRLVDAAVMPAVGDIVHFGEKATESIALKVKGVEGGEDFSSVLHMVAAAPEIDTLTDAEDPPAWDGRVGSEIVVPSVTPSAPVVTRITSAGAYTAGDPGDPPEPLAGTITVLLKPGPGSTALLSSYRVSHRLKGTTPWTDVSIPVGTGGGDITGYTTEDVVELHFHSIATDGAESVATSTVEVTVGQNDAPLPTSPDTQSVSVLGGLGHARISVAIAYGTDMASIQVYRAPSGVTLDRETHAIGDPVTVFAGTTLTYVDGDSTRADLALNGGFDDGSDWSTDADWAIAAGVATHSDGDADTIYQALTLSDGTEYILRFAVSGRTAGSITPQFFGGSGATGTAVSADGEEVQSITATAGNTSFGFLATTDFDGSIDDVSIYAVTDAAVAPGAYDYYLEPLNSAGAPGPITGPHAGTVL